MYDLRFVGLFGDRDDRRSDWKSSAYTQEQLRASALAGEELPLRWGAYFGFAKSLVDDNWHYAYTFDTELSPCQCPFLDTADRVTLNNAVTLVYVRRDVQ